MAFWGGFAQFAWRSGTGLGAILAAIGALWSGGDDGAADKYLTTGDGRTLTRGP